LRTRSTHTLFHILWATPTRNSHPFQLSSQFKFVSFPEGAPFESLCSFVKEAVKPFMESALSRMSEKKGNSVQAEGSAGAGSEIDAVNALVRKLTQLQQNIALPEVVLTHHQAVRAAVQRDANVKVEDFKEADPQDPKLLNALEKLVQRWVREIKKITEHTRDIKTGTAPGKALQEVRFWLGWEAALGQIKEKLESREVRLTIELLRQGNRFHVTTGFEQDTGIQQAMEKASDYAPLMKDFGQYLERLDSAPSLCVVTPPFPSPSSTLPPLAFFSLRTRCAQFLMFELCAVPLHDL
jgi:hypothetical protein